MDNKVREYELEVKQPEPDEDMYEIEGSFMKGFLNALLIEGLFFSALVVVELLISLI